MAALEGSVADQFGVETTIAAVVDFLFLRSVVLCHVIPTIRTSSITPYCRLVVTLLPDLPTLICTAAPTDASNGRRRYSRSMFVGIERDQQMHLADPPSDGPWIFCREGPASIYVLAPAIKQTNSPESPLTASLATPHSSDRDLRVAVSKTIVSSLETASRC